MMGKAPKPLSSISRASDKRSSILPGRTPRMRIVLMILRALRRAAPTALLALWLIPYLVSALACVNCINSRYESLHWNGGWAFTSGIPSDSPRWRGLYFGACWRIENLGIWVEHRVTCEAGPRPDTPAEASWESQRRKNDHAVGDWSPMCFLAGHEAAFRVSKRRLSIPPEHIWFLGQAYYFWIGQGLLGGMIFAQWLLFTGPSIFRWRRRRRRLRSGLCPACGYDLRGGHTRCPECGVETALTPAAAEL